ncbi:Energy-coupling factor transporter ATP-binding protein EcfA3 [Corynebacterium felinum]|nr:Energy-coupling factor transporter ATP-binding protein EcfA3 [Corynebacterium felinum]
MDVTIGVVLLLKVKNMVLRISNIHKSFGEKKVLNGVNFNVHKGEIFSLLAANGGGKTTLMRIIMGLLPADSGEIHINDVQVQPGSVKGVGYMPEERGLYVNETVRKQLRYFALLHKVPADTVDKRIDKILAQLDVEQYADSKVKHLSLGNKQRVQIAAALIHEPELLILDEPFSGLDPMSVERLIALLKEYARGGRTIVFSSHQIDIVDRISDTLAVMKEGVIVFQGDPSSLKLRDELTVVHIHAVFEEGRSVEDLDFSQCSSVHSWDGLTLTLNSDHITVEELMKSGLQGQEIRGVDYQKQSLTQALESLYDGAEGMK